MRNDFNSAKNCYNPVCLFTNTCKKYKQPDHGKITCEPQTKVVPTEFPSK